MRQDSAKLSPDFVRYFVAGQQGQKSRFGSPRSKANRELAQISPTLPHWHFVRLHYGHIIYNICTSAAHRYRDVPRRNINVS